jgi:hypothetical protein
VAESRSKNVESCNQMKHIESFHFKEPNHNFVDRCYLKIIVFGNNFFEV